MQLRCGFTNPVPENYGTSLFLFTSGKVSRGPFS